MSVTYTSFRLFPFIALLGALTVFVLPAKAQHDPLCFQMFFPVVSAAPGDTVCMPLMVRDFDNMLSSQFAVQWDEAALKFIDRGFSDSPLAGIAYAAFIGHVNIAWLDPMFGNITLPDSTVIMKFYFRVEPGNTGMQRLTIGDGSLEGGFGMIQLETSVFDYNYLPLAQQFGGVYIGNTQPNTLAISTSCTRDATCENATGEASIVVEGGMPPYTYSWTGPANFIANTAIIQSVKAGDYEFTVTDAVGDTLAGSIRVDRNLSQMTTSATQQSAVCGQANGCASITAQGGIEPYTFHWPSGNSGLSENCMLAQGWYDMLVSDANGCEGMVNFYIGDSIDTNY
jgi:hypothetical protein